MRGLGGLRPRHDVAEAEVVVVHSSDLHIDDDYTARAFGGDGAGALAAVLDAARRVAADLVVLAGDVFEHNRLPLDLLERTARLLAEAGRPVVLLPGNHDPAIADSVYTRGAIADPANVHVLGVTAEDAVHFPELDLEVWGRAHRDYADMAPLARPRPRTTRFQIAAAHGHFEPAPDPTRALRPGWLISAAELEATRADYVALGHWNRHVRVGNGRVVAFYSGSPDFAGSVNVVRLSATGRALVAREPVHRPGASPA
jgi:DNA repair exonuclease SbcCD nuclease subunit